MRERGDNANQVDGGRTCVTWQMNKMSEHSRIKIGQVFRVPYRGQPADRSGLASYQELTRGIHEKSADLQKGMFFYQHVPEPGQKFARIPAFIFHSNPFKSGGEGAPWVDVVEPAAALDCEIAITHPLFPRYWCFPECGISIDFRISSLVDPLP